MTASFDFTKYLAFLESKGRELFNPNFKVIGVDYEIIFQLLVYFLQDAEGAKKYNLSFRKGILLSGPVGCGKTSLMSLLKFCLPEKNRYIVKSCREVNFEFIKDGYSVIEKYSRLSYNKDVPKPIASTTWAPKTTSSILATTVTPWPRSFSPATIFLCLVKCLPILPPTSPAPRWKITTASASAVD